MAVTDVRFRQHLRKGGEVALLAYVDHPAATMKHFWSRSGDLVWKGDTYKGVGILGRISGISKTTTLEVKQITLSLRGVPPTSTEFLSATVRNRSVKIWLAAISRNKVVGEPFLLIDDLMDFQKLRINDDGTATLEITINVGFWTIERAVNKAWTHEAQIAKFPDDTGLSQIPLLANKQSNWRQSAS